MVKGKRLSFYRRFPKYISLKLIQSRTLNSLIAILKHVDYWTLNLLRTRSKRNQLSAYLSFSRKTIACIGTNTKTRYKAEEKFIRKHDKYFLYHLHINCEKQPSASCYPSCSTRGRIRSSTEFFLWFLFLL